MFGNVLQRRLPPAAEVANPLHLRKVLQVCPVDIDQHLRWCERVIISCCDASRRAYAFVAHAYVVPVFCEFSDEFLGDLDVVARSFSPFLALACSRSSRWFPGFGSRHDGRPQSVVAYLCDEYFGAYIL